MDLNEVIQKIKQASITKVRTVPMAGQPAIDGKYQIEINENGAWNPVLTGTTRSMAEDIINQAHNRVILG